MRDIVSQQKCIAVVTYQLITELICRATEWDQGLPNSFRGDLARQHRRRFRRVAGSDLHADHARANAQTLKDVIVQTVNVYAQEVQGISEAILFQCNFDFSSSMN